jgi:hypothetical protein
VVTGSQNINVLEAITQSLAGRVALHTLLPFAVEELRDSGTLGRTLNEVLFTGFYPRIHDRGLDASDWLSNYVQTYVERDLRQMKNVADLSTFSRFLRHCAARSGQLVNYSSLANDCGVNHNTAKSWLSILEASYILFLSRPYHRTFEKRLRRSPKLYFYDTGLLCYLLGIKEVEALATHANRGHIFESFLVSEISKAKFNRGTRPELHFWQDKVGNEIDCVMDVSGRMVAVEAKSGETVTADYFKNLKYWRALTGVPREDCFVVYAGDARQERENGRVLPWFDIYGLPL